MIYNKYLNNDMKSKVSIILDSMKKSISIKNIVFVVLSLVLAGQTFIGDSTPFSFVLFGVASVFNVPLLLVLISSAIGLAFSSITSMLLIKLLAFFVVFTFITALINIEGVSRRYSVFIKFIASFAGVEILFHFIQGTLLTSLVSVIGNILIVGILYFVFVSGIYVLVNMKKGYVYSKEESVAMVTVMALAMAVLKNVQILNFSVFNILVAVLILIYGWRNGAVMGSAAGLIVGLCLTGVNEVSMTYVVSLAFSGCIAGLLSRVGKIGVVIGFVIGNLYISYYANGFSELAMRMSEILIASISLLFMPKTLEKKLSEFFDLNRAIPRAYENMLDTASNVRNRVGAVSEVFDSLAEITVEVSPEDKKETREVIQKYFEDYVENTCIDCKKRKDCVNTENLGRVVDYVATKLENNQKIEPKMLTFECESAEQIVTDIEEVYNSMKLMRILKQKEQENSTKLSNQYKEVSKILSSIAKNIKNTPVVVDKAQEKLRNELKFYGFIVYEDEFVREGGCIEYTFVTDILNDIDKQKRQITSIATEILEQNMTIKLILNISKSERSKIKIVSIPDYEVQTSIVSETKTGETISGDSYLSMELQDLKQLNVLSDGAGSGAQASKGSTTVINMLEKLLSGGFDEQKTIEIINSTLKLKGDDTTFSTLDTLIVNLKNGDAQFIKIGAAPTYVIEDGKITTITNINMPMGLVKDTDYVPIGKKLKDNAIVIQISDGVVTDHMDTKDNYFAHYLAQMDVAKTTKSIAEELHKLVLKENKNVLADDVTIMVTKVVKVQK